MIKAIKHKCTYPNCPYPCLDLPDCIDAEKQKVSQEPVIDKSAAIRIATQLGWQPKREWVGLTEEDKKSIVNKKAEGAYLSVMQTIELTEAKLKEKNSA